MVDFKIMLLFICSKVTTTTDFENVNKVMMLDHTTEAKHHEIPPDIHEALPSEAASLHLRYIIISVRLWNFKDGGS